MHENWRLVVDSEQLRYLAWNLEYGVWVSLFVSALTLKDWEILVDHLRTWMKWNDKMKLWSIAKISGSNTRVMVNNVMLNSNPEMLPCSYLTYSEELVDPLSLEVWTFSGELRNLFFWEMIWTIFQDPVPPYTYRYFITFCFAGAIGLRIKRKNEERSLG